MSNPLDTPIYISDRDREHLNLLLEGLTDPRSRQLTERLRSEIQRANIVPVAQLDGETVQIGSTVSLRDLDSGEIEKYTLTLPEHADPQEGRVSVLAPLGTAILGYRTGDEIEWEMPRGTRRLRILSVSQPVAAGAR